MSEWILASSSPRRQELLGRLPITFSVKVAEVEERLSSMQTPRENVESLAKQKAAAVAKAYPDQWVIGCDTLVALEEDILGKPPNHLMAKEMLRKLSGKKHAVYTGVCVANEGEGFYHVFSEKTIVQMKTLSEKEIEIYLATDEPLDKAGAYGIQGQGALYVERIEGDYYNVMGLPLSRLYQELCKLNKL